MVDTDCAHPLCLEGQCGVDLEPADTAANWQVPHDCKKNACDGAGNIVQANDDTDAPTDGNSCTDDTCSNWEPQHSPVAAGEHRGQEPSMSCDGAGNCTVCTDPCPAQNCTCLGTTCGNCI